MSSKRSFTSKQMFGGSFLSLCETRWVKRHDNILQFQDGFIPIVEALGKISAWEESSSSSKSKSICDQRYQWELSSLIVHRSSVQEQIPLLLKTRARYKIVHSQDGFTIIHSPWLILTLMVISTAHQDLKYKFAIFNTVYKY